MKYEQMNNVSRTLVYRKSVAAGDSGYIDGEVTAHGFIKQIRVRFAAGENGTLHIRPLLIIPPDVPIELLNYAGDKYVSGDDETFISDLKFEVENNAIIRVYYDNTGIGLSQLNVDIEVEYFSIVEPENIIG